MDTSTDYLGAPETRLNTWLPDGGDEIFAHYGAAYLFVVYFWEQYGDQAIQDLLSLNYELEGTVRCPGAPEPEDRRRRQTRRSR